MTVADQLGFNSAESGLPAVEAVAAIPSSLVEMAHSLEISYADSLSTYPTSADFVARVPIAFARRHNIMGFAGPNQTLLLAMCALDSWQQLDVMGRFLGREVRALFAPQEAIAAAINEAYQQRTGQAEAMIQNLDRASVLEEVQRLGSREDLLDTSGRAPVIKLVNLILFEAVKGGASDVHIQPTESNVAVRVRLDGLLFDAFDLPKNLQEEVIGRLKVMGRMNIAEKRLAQDGRATVQVGDRTIDLRLASLPTSYGERIVVRLLDKSARLYRLTELGMAGETRARFCRLIGLDHGLILVTGPTGSGKTTTLYAALKEIDCREHNVLTLEDPIEYQLEGISQSQVSDKKGMTFASGLRSVLRQDPDVIMVGEIRDRETASMAIQSALTGHLVFSTLHTNDAASAVTRLLDLGTEPYLVASSLVGVLAQRLVRKVCAECAESLPASPQDLSWLGADGDISLRRGAGCDTCRKTGYRGRVGIFELMTITEKVRQHIQACATASQIKSAAVADGMHTLRDDGVRKIRSGVSTIEEVDALPCGRLGHLMPSRNRSKDRSMAVYAYKAFDPLANEFSATISGTVPADSPRQARDLLRQRGLTVEHLIQVELKKAHGFTGSRRDGRRVTAFTRELSTLLGVGTPLSDALETMASQHRGSFRSTLLLLREQVTAGSSLAAAMANQPIVFDDLCINLIEVGEESGTLESSLEQVARFRERRQQLRGKVGTALLYPCFVLATALGVSIFLMTYVVPTILQPLMDQGRPLPLPTRIVKGISDFLVSWGWLLAVVSTVLAISWAVLIRTKRGRWMWDSLLLRLPLIGSLLRKSAVVRIAVIIETLMRSGVVFVRAIRVARGSIRNVVLQDALNRCEEAVSAGRDIAPALQASGAFPPLVVQVFSVGQQSGRLEEMLQRLAKDYDDQVATAAQRLTSILEPVLILILATIVATIALATMLPILEASNVLG